MNEKKNPPIGFVLDPFGRPISAAAWDAAWKEQEEREGGDMNYQTFRMWRSAFFEGVATLLALCPPPIDDTTELYDDQEAIAGDFRAVGCDMRRAFARYDASRDTDA